MKNLPYCKEELYEEKRADYYPAEANEAAFLLGGIGTGNVSVGTRGQLRDWEIFNKPGKGNVLPYSFFAIRTESESGDSLSRVLEAKLQPPFSQSHGFDSEEVGGLPRLDDSRLRGEGAFVQVEFEDDQLPVEVTMEAFTPFIPLNPDDSGIPGAVIRYKVSNPTEEKLDVSVAGSLANAVGFEGYGAFNRIQLAGEGKNEYRAEEGREGIFFSSPELDPDHLTYGSMALMTGEDEEHVTAKPNWLESGWFDGIHDFWDDFRDDGLLEETDYEATGSELGNRRGKVGSLGIFDQLAPGEEREFEFVLSWHFPNRPKGWGEPESCCCEESCEKPETVKNYYATLFSDAWEAGGYLLEEKERLEGRSRDFRDALYESTLPSYVIEALDYNATVIKSPTCFRIEDGTFLGWEGCHDKEGCCPGSCTHVWNYAQTMAFLFPQLERSMRKVEFNLETDEEGQMTFRTQRVFGREPWDMLPATDGQMGTIVRLYRDWKISGDDELLETVWEKAGKALDFAFEYWDSDGDFVLDSQQHNTYDIEFYGPNSLTNSIFFAALRAGREMAEYMDDEERAERYERACREGSERMDELLWNGEYYVQKIEDVNEYRYQYGKGCLSDQLLGQFLAHVAGLGHILPEEHVKSGVKSIFRHNFRSSLEEHHNPQRTYALNDEKGLLLCSWPNGGRPKIPFVYSDEVWTGIEYQVASHLIYEGFVEEGLTIAKATRERHDGYRRNPWNEVECGHHYARSMASWGLLLALSGFQYDMDEGKMGFSPRIAEDDFKTFWSTGQAWGTYVQRKDPETGELKRDVQVLYGESEGVELEEPLS